MKKVCVNPFTVVTKLISARIGPNSPIFKQTSH